MSRAGLLIRSTTLRKAAVAALFAAALFAGPLGAEEDVPIPLVPEVLPLDARNALGQARQQVVARVEAYNATGRAFTSRCGRVPADDSARIAACGSEFAKLNAEADALVEAKQRFAADLAAAVAADAGCAGIAAQLERDKAALRTEQKSIESTVRDLEEWGAASAQAQADAVDKGVALFISGGVAKLEQKENSARTLKDWMARYRNQMVSGQLPVDEGIAKLERTFEKYQRARSLARFAPVGRQVKSIHELGEHWDAFKIETGVIAHAEADSDADVKAALADPRFQQFVNEDATGSEALRTALDLVTATPAFKKIAPEYALASFAVDYGYDVRKWRESRERILQGNHVTEDALRAVDALKHQLERTVTKLKACRAR